MKNELIKLAGFRKIYDLIYAWVEAKECPIYVDFEVYDNKVYLELSSERAEIPIDADVVAEIEDLFLADCPLDDTATDIRVYLLGEVECKFTASTLELLEYATDEGFVVSEYAYNHISGEVMIDFILDNPTFTIESVADDDERKLIIKWR